MNRQYILIYCYAIIDNGEIVIDGPYASEPKGTMHDFTQNTDLYDSLYHKYEIYPILNDDDIVEVKKEFIYVHGDGAVVENGNDYYCLIHAPTVILGSKVTYDGPFIGPISTKMDQIKRHKEVLEANGRFNIKIAKFKDSQIEELDQYVERFIDELERDGYQPGLYVVLYLLAYEEGSELKFEGPYLGPESEDEDSATMACSKLIEEHKSNAATLTKVCKNENRDPVQIILNKNRSYFAKLKDNMIKSKEVTDRPIMKSKKKKYLKPDDDQDQN